MRIACPDDPSSGSHLPVLMKVVSLTTGPILEVGAGFHSTPYLHWMCLPTKRRIVTYENSVRFYELFSQYATEFHDMIRVDDWNAVDVGVPWSVALVDQLPMGTRVETIRRIPHCEYIVLHDSGDRLWRRMRKNRSEPIFPLFKYRYDYTETYPATTVLSNVHDLKGFAIP